MQNPIVMAFRKRMKSHGYTSIEIYKIRPFSGFYAVSAVEPLSGTKVFAKLNHLQMQDAFRF